MYIIYVQKMHILVKLLPQFRQYIHHLQKFPHVTLFKNLVVIMESRKGELLINRYKISVIQDE